MKTLRIEIKALDPLRWAFLHLPLEIALGVYLAGWTLRWELWDEMLSFFFLTATLIGMIWVAVWFQAVLLNFLIALMRRGPVLYVQQVEVAPSDFTPLGYEGAMSPEFADRMRAIGLSPDDEAPPD